MGNYTSCEQKPTAWQRRMQQQARENRMQSQIDEMRSRVHSRKIRDLLSINRELRETKNKADRRKLSELFNELARDLGCLDKSETVDESA